MALTLQQFMADRSRKAATELLAEAKSLAPERRNWRPLDKGRTAQDQVAECALINKQSVETIRTGVWGPANMDEFFKAKAALAADWDGAIQALEAGIEDLAVTIADVSDAALDTAFDTPYGKHTVLDVVTYGYWNMVYHQGQITYIHLLTE